MNRGGRGNDEIRNPKSESMTKGVHEVREEFCRRMALRATKFGFGLMGRIVTGGLSGFGRRDGNLMGEAPVPQVIIRSLAGWGAKLNTWCSFVPLVDKN